MLEALPGALVVAIVLPIAVQSGVTAFPAIAAAAVMTVLRHNGFIPEDAEARAYSGRRRRRRHDGSDPLSAATSPDY